MITALNPRVSLVICVLALLGLENETGDWSFIAFLLGFLVTLPLIALVWKTMKKNWQVYRKFYIMGYHHRDMSVIRKSWKLTWWIIPYTVIIYSALDVWILLNPGYGSPISLLCGVLFAVFGYTALQGPKYYEDVLKKRK
jgi:hypothetical protein